MAIFLNIVGIILIVLGVFFKMNVTRDEERELREMRRRRLDASGEFGPPLSMREMNQAAGVLLFLLSPRGLIIAGVFWRTYRSQQRQRNSPQRQQLRQGKWRRPLSQPHSTCLDQWAFTFPS